MRYTFIGHDERVVDDASLADLIKAFPYFVEEYGVFPPLSILNSVLRQGEFNAGMSGAVRWEPFEISEVEYKELIDALYVSHRCQPVDVPAWVQSYSDFVVWEVEKTHGVPADEHRRLRDEIAHFSVLRDEAMKHNDVELARHYDAKAGELGVELSELLNRTKK